MTEDDLKSRISILEQRLKSSEQRFLELRELDATALKLQAAEYERRLGTLNGEHARIAAAQSTYVSYSVLAAVVAIIIAIITLLYPVHLWPASH
jgi:hypothetical protein